MRTIAPEVETVQLPIEFLDGQDNRLVRDIGRCFESLGFEALEPKAQAVALVSRPQEFHLQPLAEPT